MFVFAFITGNTSETFKVSDLNAQADASGDDEDDIDWEEGWVIGSIDLLNFSTILNLRAVPQSHLQPVFQLAITLWAHVGSINWCFLGSVLLCETICFALTDRCGNEQSWYNGLKKRKNHYTEARFRNLSMFGTRPYPWKTQIYCWISHQ